MTDKVISKSLPALSSKQETENPVTFTLSESQVKRTSTGFIPAVLRLDEKIQQLKKKKERIQTQQATLFMREAQKVFEADFTPSLALLILSETWKEASGVQKTQWKKRGSSFQLDSFQRSQQKTQIPETAVIES